MHQHCIGTDTEKQRFAGGWTLHSGMHPTYKYMTRRQKDAARITHSEWLDSGYPRQMSPSHMIPHLDDHPRNKVTYGLCTQASSPEQQRRKQAQQQYTHACQLCSQQTSHLRYIQPPRKTVATLLRSGKVAPPLTPPPQTYRRKPKPNPMDTETNVFAYFLSSNCHRFYLPDFALILLQEE